MEMFLLIAVIVLVLSNALLFIALRGTEKRVEIAENDVQILFETLGLLEGAVNKALVGQRDLWNMQTEINDALVGKRG